MNFQQFAAACVALLFFVLSSPVVAADDSAPSADETKAAMKSAATFFGAKVARHGGYVYFYSLDLKHRAGEGVASEDQIWVQPPGTPTVGMAYLQAFEATGDKFYLDAATQAAEALVYGQLKSGGWTNCIDFNPQGDRAALYRNGKGRGRNFSSLDDNQTQAALRLLMRVDRAHQFKHEAIHEAANVGLSALLAAQFNNGAFPQGWDETLAGEQPVLKASFPKYDWRTEGRVKNYWDMYTLNDNLAGDVSQTLIEAHQIYGDDRYLQSLARLGDFLILAQLPEPQPAWAQQYNYQMHPIWARKFEPAAITGAESQDVLEALLLIHEATGDAKYLKPIPRAIAYLRKSEIADGQLARYYELETNRPLYMQRRGKVYSLTYSDADLPSHYGWKHRHRLDKIAAAYQSALRGDATAKKQPSAKSLAKRAAPIIAALDDQGRWLSTSDGSRMVGDQRFAKGEQFIASQVFSENLETLSAYVKAKKN